MFVDEMFRRQPVLDIWGSREGWAAAVMLGMV